MNSDLAEERAAFRAYAALFAEPDGTFCFPVRMKSFHTEDVLRIAEWIMDHEKGSAFSAEERRFALLAESAAIYLKESGWKADIVHSHDWTAGLVPFYLDKYRIKAKTIFTIHNLAYQGDFSRYDAVLSGDRLPDDAFCGRSGSERLNVLRAGITEADIITTVSPTYAKEITTPELGCGMDEILRRRPRDRRCA